MVMAVGFLHGYKEQVYLAELVVIQVMDALMRLDAVRCLEYQ